MTEENGPHSESVYFDLQASWGVTKHIGDRQATRELAAQCDVNRESYVLIIGCGVGVAACYLAEQHGCRVMGIDISQRMVDRSTERAKKKGLQDRVEFRCADAQSLPFGDSLFDVVFCESVNAFIPDQRKAMAEYVRVLNAGGYVGLNECVWVETPPAELVDYLERAMGAEFFPAHEGWKAMMEQAGLGPVSETIHTTSAVRQWANEVREIDPRDMAMAYLSFPVECIRNPACRRFVKDTMRLPRSIFRMFRYFGYGLYVGRKPRRVAAAS
ncbi:MAG: class I SAM-dependent methyltransferase [Dehalococcoidia bacterium]|nr:class I SAM-dependent methyltransferase [Dehalococcoidia bacterium]